jgi:hypothetical protein
VPDRCGWMIWPPSGSLYPKSSRPSQMLALLIREMYRKEGILFGV